VNETLEKIIQLIDRNIKDFYREPPSNSGDTYLATRISKGCQLIFGVCNSDRMDSDVRFYKERISEELRQTNFYLDFLSFPYREKNMLIKVLQGLSDNYKADLNINRLIRDVNFNDDSLIFIVITVVSYSIILPIETI